MYDHIEGLVTERQAARVVVRAGGVGFELKVPMGTADALAAGRPALLYTILHVVDGTPTLLGFATRAERELSKKLMTVAGVGPAICLAVLSMYTPAQVGAAIVEGNHPLLRRAKGVGPKTAERLCLELRDQMAKMDLGQARPEVPLVPQSAEDAIAALVTLGFTEREAREKVGKAAAGRDGMKTEELVKAVLRA